MFLIMAAEYIIIMGPDVFVLTLKACAYCTFEQPGEYS